MRIEIKLGMTGPARLRISAGPGRAGQSGPARRFTTLAYGQYARILEPIFPKISETPFSEACFPISLEINLIDIVSICDLICF